MSDYNIVPHMPEELYRAASGWSSTLVSSLSRSGREYLYYLNHKKTGRSFDIGHLFHQTVLQPEMKSSIVALPETRVNEKGKTVKVVKSGKWWEEYQELNAGKIMISKSDFEQLEDMTDSLLLHPLAGQLLNGLKHTELSLFYRRDWWGDCKARLDGYGTIDGVNGYVFELKTTCRKTPVEFIRSFRRYGYHVQAAWYLDAARRCGFTPEFHYVVAVCSAPPYPVMVFKTHQSMLDKGEADIQVALEREWNENLHQPEYPELMLLVDEDNFNLDIIGDNNEDTAD